MKFLKLLFFLFKNVAISTGMTENDFKKLRYDLRLINSF
jgi:hypothetical protein